MIRNTQNKNYNIMRELERQGITGISSAEINILRRAEMTLRRWHEAEANGDIQPDCRGAACVCGR